MSTNSVAQSDIFEFLENTDLGDLKLLFTPLVKNGIAK